MRPNLYKHMRSLLPAAAEVPRLPQQVWNPHSRQAAVRSRQHPDSGPSPRTGISPPRFRQLRASVPISDSEPHRLHVIRASLCDPQRNTCPCPSGRKHSAAFMGLLPWKTRDRKCAPNIPTARRQLPTPQQQAVNPAPNEASNPYPAASGHGSARRRQQHPGSGQWDRAGHSPHAVRPPLQSSRTEQVQNKRIPPPQDSYLTGAGWQNKVGRLLPYAYGRRYLMITERLAFWCFS